MTGPLGPVHDSSVPVRIASASSEDSGEYALMRRLTRAFASRIHKAWVKMILLYVTNNHFSFKSGPVFLR